MTTLDLQHLMTHHATGARALAAAFPAAAAAATAAPGLGGQLHILEDGSALVSSGVTDQGNGHVVLTGAAGGLPFELELGISLQDSEITVTLQLTKPFPLGPFTFKYRLGGATVVNGAVVAAASVMPVDLATPAAAAVAGGLGHGLILCVVRCGGRKLLPILVACLPSLVGGPPAYIACVVASAGAGAAGIAKCVADCMH